MAKAATAKKQRANYGAVEFVLILIALALVALTAWYVRRATVNANSTYSITESSQTPAASKKTPANQ